jgi:hypothetical protein
MDLNQGAFDFAEGRSLRRIETPAARRTDPESSHLAAEHVNANGVRAAQQQAAFAAVKAFPNHTSRELAKLCKRKRHELARRLPECRTAGMVCNPLDENDKPIALPIEGTLIIRRSKPAPRLKV